MANKTFREASSVHGRNPQHLIENVIRQRIYESAYWKEQCFALTAETIIDKAVEMQSIGGVYGNLRPLPFICLLLKLLQLQPEPEIILEYLQAVEFKYLRALAAMYTRLCFNSYQVFDILEPLLQDYRKLRLRNNSGYHITHMDEFVDELLTEERVCDIILPRLTKRDVLEQVHGLPIRKSPLDVEDDNSENEDDNISDRYVSRSPSPTSDAGSDRYLSKSPSGSPVPQGEEEEDRYISRSPSPVSDA
ncbi:PRP38-domain-containing protein [Wallemia mellicola]|uniref:Pre-mRNA-splicing factor 38 n=1 Tax=Wallemia mellicola TaxID=1708541 RepID=A0A4T0R3Y9_9BASI|nr:PRP38-domain-containing protein [Wallemia mellicola]TIC29397.1 PRP38-domain-containing protein [Wallemia mellicola]TIC31268.1 PRP38-domain-containing protein [Wallemia mellicola]